MGNGILDQIEDTHITELKKLTPEMLSDLISELQMKMQSAGPDYVTYTGNLDYNNVKKVIARERLLDTLRNL